MWILDERLIDKEDYLMQKGGRVPGVNINFVFETENASFYQQRIY